MVLSDLRRFLESEQERRAALRTEAEAARRRLDAFERIARILRGLRTSWKDEDPGKYGLHVFLATTWEIDLTDGQRPYLAGVDAFHALELMDGYRENEPHSGRVERLTGRKVMKCADCGAGLLPVGTYAQVEDSPEGDTWLMQLYELCIRCERLTLIAEKVSGSRMSLRRHPER